MGQDRVRVTVRKKKGSFHHRNLRRALIDTVVLMVARDGTQAVNLRALAAHLGVTAAAPYRHFASKDELLSAVAEEGFGLMIAEILATITPIPDALERWEEIGATYVQFALTRPGYFRLMYGPELANRRAHPGLDAAAQKAFALLVETIRQAQDAGQVTGLDPNELAVISWSLVHGLTDLMLNKQIYGETPDARRARAVARNATRILRIGVGEKPAKKKTR
jgi:AcrR family transcriptional regulator